MTKETTEELNKKENLLLGSAVLKNRTGHRIQTAT